jgi:hypothetical protein
VRVMQSAGPVLYGDYYMPPRRARVRNDPSVNPPRVWVPTFAIMTSHGTHRLRVGPAGVTLEVDGTSVAAIWFLDDDSKELRIIGDDGAARDLLHKVIDPAETLSRGMRAMFLVECVEEVVQLARRRAAATGGGQ